MKKLPKKLTIAKETLRNLESESMENVLGAATLSTCVSNCGSCVTNCGFTACALC